MSLADIRRRDPVAGYAIARTLNLEGGFVDDPADPGGATNHGVSLRFALQAIEADEDLRRMLDVDHDGDVDRNDIRALSLDQAADLYFLRIWLAAWYGKLAPQLLAWKCFDIAVNAGPNRSALTLQKALVRRGANIAVDAVVGPKTVAATKAATQADGGSALMAEIRLVQAAFYQSLVDRAPKLRRFLAGWLNRAAA